MDFIEYNDIIALKNFRKFLDFSKKEKLFTKTELNLYGKELSKASLAVRYLIKKNLKTEFDIDFQNIEILNDTYGKPILKIKGKKKNNIKFSMSHSKNFATVFLIIYNEN